MDVIKSTLIQTVKLCPKVLSQSSSRPCKANYPNNFVVKWEKERRGLDVELNNDIDLKISTTERKVKLTDSC